jgi:hypothetical protein
MIVILLRQDRTRRDDESDDKNEAEKNSHR